MPILRGIDVSNNNGMVDWTEVAAAPVDFAFVKVTEGVSFFDGYFLRNWAGIKASGIPVRGAYHFCHPELFGPQMEADWFTRMIGPHLAPGDLVVLDCEEGGTMDRSAWLVTCAAAVGKTLGFPCGVYSYLDYIQRCLQESMLDTLWLWLAAYGSQMPASPRPWREFKIWQYSEKGAIPGVNGNCDLNQADCTIADLLALGKPAPIVARLAQVKTACALKSEPSHTPPSQVLAKIPGPPRGLIIDTGVRKLTAGESWTRIQFRDHFGWVLANNVEAR